MLKPNQHFTDGNAFLSLLKTNVLYKINFGKPI